MRIEKYSEELRKKYGRVTFGRFLQAWRTAEELSQVEFAKKLRLSAANLCDLEQGRRIPSVARARQIARRLKLPEKGFVVLAIQDQLEREGMKYQVELSEVA